MDGMGLHRLLEQAEARVRQLLERTSRDDSYASQVELREAVEVLRSIRARLEGAGEGAPA